MKLEDISPKQDDAQRLLALNGVPRIYWLSAEEINLILRNLLALMGKESALYKGEYANLPALEAAHPFPEPGSEAQLIVVDGDNLKASWDNTNKKWFEDGVYVVPGSDAAYLLKSVHDVDNDGIIDKAKDIAAMLTAGPNSYYGTDAAGNIGVYALPSGTDGGTTTNNAINKINAFSAGYIGGLSYSPYMDFDFGSINYKVTTNLTLAPADVTFSRIDLIVGNSNGTITKITGVPAANPVEPAINNDTQLKGAFILIEANATAPSGVSLKKIYDENLGNAGGELDVSITAGAGWNLADVSNPKKGTKAIKGTNLQDLDQLQFTPTIKIPGAEFTELVLYVKNLKVSALADPFYFYLFGDTVTRGRGTATQFLQNLSKFGYDKNNITDWQFIAIPIAVLGITEIRYLQLVNKEVGFDVLIDGISYNDGSAPTGNEFATTGYVIAEVEAAKTEVLAEAKAYTDAQIAASLAWQHRYTTITTLLANQAEQTTTKPQFVFDASIDPTVNTASTWAVYELKDIAVKTGALSDYRKLSEQESMDVAASGGKQGFIVTKQCLWGTANSGDDGWRIWNGTGLSTKATATNVFVDAISNGSINNQINSLEQLFVAPFDCKIVSARIVYYTASGRTFEFGIGSYTFQENSLYNATMPNPVQLFSKTETAITLRRTHRVFNPVDAIVLAGDSIIFGIREPNGIGVASLTITVQFYLEKL